MPNTNGLDIAGSSEEKVPLQPRASEIMDFRRKSRTNTILNQHDLYLHSKLLPLYAQTSGYPRPYDFWKMSITIILKRLRWNLPKLLFVKFFLQLVEMSH
ncbi:hypothetical protein STEG23_003077, partial [Scotinomys teguina]